MPLNDEIRLLPDGRKLVRRETDVDIDDAVTPRAGKMVVMLAPTTDTKVMRPICKLDAGQQPPIHQLFNRTVDRGPAYAWLGLP
jgi:hypothetical protein